MNHMRNYLLKLYVFRVCLARYQRVYFSFFNVGVLKLECMVQETGVFHLASLFFASISGMALFGSMFSNFYTVEADSVLLGKRQSCFKLQTFKLLALVDCMITFTHPAS